jgi:16S rRNA (guanine527-N7)-methyltransferase
MPRTDGIEPAAVRALAARYGLIEAQAHQLLALGKLLVSDRHAPTAIREPRAILDDHLADSLVALELPELRSARSVADLGSGAGLPGLVLAIARPDAEFTLIETSQRKCSFIERAADASGVGNVEVVHARAESWPEGLGRFDVATARALASLEVVVEYAAPLLAVGGTLVAWRGRREPDAEAAAAAGAPIVGMKPGRVVAAAPYRGSLHRHLHLVSKVMETPAEFPRRPGAAQKRPLSGLLGRA